MSEMIKNHYEILGVRNDASYDDVKRAWREKAKQWHPDKFLSAEEKLKAHERFVDILEAYSVLVDANKRAIYDAQMADTRSDRQYSDRQYRGYENATTAADQKEAVDWFQRVMAETPLEFTKTTFFLLLLVPVFLLIWLGVIGIIVALFDFVTGKSQLGLGGAIMLIFFLLTSTALSLFGILVMKDLYYRAKRIVTWAILRARGRRIFSRSGIRPPGADGVSLMRWRSGFHPDSGR